MRYLDSLVAPAALLIAAPAAAGVVLHEVQSGESYGRPSHTVVDVSAEGDGLRSDVVESDSPVTQAGMYMLYPSDDVMVVVNPANKTYMTLDMSVVAAMQQQGQRVAQQMSGMDASTHLENVVINKKVDEAGPIMLGVPTQHVVYEVSYNRLAGGAKQEYHERYEIWATHGLDARLAAAPALTRLAGRPQGPGAADEPKEVREAIASHGLALKQVSTVENRMSIPGVSALMMGPMALMHRGGQKQSSTSEVTAFREEAIPAARFALPKDYTETSMMSPNQSAMPDLGKLPGRPGAPPGPAGAQPPGAAPPAAPPQMPDLNNIPK
ncbi:MAG TPA: hypothetical protein VED45_09180 [Steroidobacteraceae bacterium]|nr:hypothetical protein [Steroidobacteraceae bacterium]